MRKHPLRDYQKRDYAALVSALRTHDAVVFVAPTGYGKTRVAGELALDARKQDKRLLFLAPWRELIPQTMARFTEIGIPSVGVMMSGYEPKPAAAVIVGTIETVRRWAPQFPELDDIDYVIADEAHRYSTDLRREMLALWKNAKLIGVTATPFRKNHGGLGDLFDEMVHAENAAGLIERGFLVPPAIYSKDPTSLKAYRILNDEAQPIPYKPRTPDAVGDIIEEWFATGVGKTLVFANSVAESKKIAAKFNDEGISAEHIDSQTHEDDRAAILKRFADGKTTIVCNHGVLCEGYDLPAIEAVILKKTGSLAEYLQMIGRGLRPAPDKDYCIVLDPFGNVFRFGFPQDYRKFTLDSAPKEKPIVLVEDDEPSDSEQEGNNRGTVPPRRPTVWAKGQLEEVDELADDPTSVMNRLEHQAEASGYGMPWAIAEFRRLFDGKLPVGKRYREETETYLRKQAKAHGLPVKWAKERTKALFS